MTDTIKGKQAHELSTKKEIIQFVKARSYQRIKLAMTDVDGIMRGKYVSKEKFLSVLEKGIGFCDVIYGWDMHDQLYEPPSKTADSHITGWHTAFPDAWGQVDVTSGRELPLENDTVMFLLDFSQAEPHNQIDPRSVLSGVIERAKADGYSFSAAAEFEFFMFDETPHSVRDKGYQGLTPITPGMFGYSMLRNSTHSEFYHGLMDMCILMDMPLEGLHTETGPGVLEAAIGHSSLLKAADNAILFKTFTKVLAERSEMMATFMAKWSNDCPGQSGHLHISGNKTSGDALFCDANKEDGFSDEMRWFIGGQQQLMPELLVMVAPTCNSYTRLIPGFWAPTEATWGVDNRTCAIRAIPGSEKSQRVEYRVSAADINPYLALAAAVGSGVWGIQNKIEPTAPISGNAYAINLDKKFSLPLSLSRSTEMFSQSKVAKEIFGEAFVHHYAMTRNSESEEERKAITDWQLKRYFEII